MLRSNALTYRLTPNHYSRYGVALVLVLTAGIARSALTPIIGPTALPFIFFFPAVAAAAWYGERGPGIIALCGSTLTANFLFMVPIDAFALKNLSDIAAISAFLFSGAIIIASIDAIHISHHKAEKMGEVFHTTLSSIGDAVIVTDKKGLITFQNSEAEKLTGWNAKEAKGKPLEVVFNIVNQDSREIVENPVNKVLNTGTTVGLANHTLLLSKNGAEIPIDDSAAPVQDSKGTILGVVLVFRDVTEHRRAQRALQQLSTIVQFSNSAIFTKNLDGIITTWNASAKRLFGYQSNEIIGQPITVLIPPERLEEEPKILASLRAGHPIDRMETVRIAKDGRRIDVSISVSPLKDGDGNIIGASKIVHDITERKKARLALEREREVLETTLASIGDAVIVTDVEDRVTFLNNEAEKITGWTSAEGQGRHLPEVFNIINEKTKKPVENPVEKVLRMGHVVGLANHTILISKDGRQIPIDDSAAPIRHRNGTLFGVVLVFRDITERKLAEESLREVDRRKDQFLAILSHELRNPLAPIRLAVAMLRKLNSMDRKLQEYNDIIDRQAGQLGRLLDDLLDMSRISSGKIVLNKARISLGAAVASAIEVSRPLIESLNHKLTVDFPAESIELNADLTRLSQVISNLLNNAAKYTKNGGEIFLTVKDDGNDAVISVRDNGIGLSPNQLNRIFDMFTQVDQSLERSQGGLGVGLSLAKNLVELHGGRIEAKSSGLGKGSEFIVHLPILKSQLKMAASPEDNHTERKNAHHRVLIADDNIDSANLLTAFLQEEGHEVHTAYDGAAAIEEVKQFKPEIAFLDIGMPKLNGYEVAKALRKEFEKRIILVAITGWGQENDKQLALHAGFDHHLTKPIELETVEQLISSVNL